jgi:hypothetical protein
VESKAGFLMTRFARLVRAGQVFALLVTVVVLPGSSADAAGPAPVGLGTAADFAVLAGSAVTNTGPTTVNGNLGVSPEEAVTGFPPGIVSNGTIHAADAVAAQAQNDLTTAYNDAAGRTGAATVAGDLGGQTLTAGVYNSASSLGLTGTLTLDGQGDENAVFIFQAGSTLTTASASHVSLIGGAVPCNVFWQVGSSATLGTDSVFTGNLLALTSITMTTGATIDGRMLARNGAATMDTNTITRALCPAAESTTTTTGPGGGATTTTGPGGGTTATTVPRTAATTTTVPGGGTTATTGPGGGVTTTTVRGARPPLASSGSREGAMLALWGLTLSTFGGLFMLLARRRRS